MGHTPCPFLLVPVQRLRRSWKGPAGETVCGHAHCWGAGCGALGGGVGRWRPAAVFSRSFPRSSCLLSVWLW